MAQSWHTQETKKKEKQNAFGNIKFPNAFFLLFLYLQKIEKPFLAAVSSTLGDRYTENVEGIYKIGIKFIIETLVEGFNMNTSSKNHIINSKSVECSSNNNTNGAKATTLNGDKTNCNSNPNPTNNASWTSKSILMSE